MPRHRHRHHHPNWFLNDERERSVKDFGTLLETVGHKLAESGQVTISGQQIVPPQECWSIVRFERMPRGELKLKLELEWYDDGNSIGTSSSADITVE